jgi:hypothetical protein
MSVREKSDRPKLQLRHGPVEIERKFLVTNDDWRRLAVRSVRGCEDKPRNMLTNVALRLLVAKHLFGTPCKALFDLINHFY